MEKSFNLDTPRLSLLPFIQNEGELLFQMFTHPFIRRYLWDDQIISQEQVEEILKKNQQLFTEEKCGLWGIREKGSGEKVGFVGLWYFFEEEQPQLLYGLYPEYAGKGYATEAANQIAAYAFNELNFSYLIASCDAPNIASQNLARRIGMEKKETRLLEGKETVFFRLQPQEVCNSG